MNFDLEKAISHRVVLLSGGEEALRLRAFRQILASPAVDEFDLETFQAGEVEPAAWIGAASTAPFLGQRRTVVVRNVLRCEDPGPLAQGQMSLSGLPETALLVLVVDDEVGDDNRQRKLVTIRKQWEKVVAGAKGLVASFSVDAKGLRQSIKSEAKRLDAGISEPAAEMLAEMTGNSLSRSLEELEKLALYVGKDAQIREADVKAVVVPTREWNIFTLVDAVVAGDAGAALRQLRIVLGGSKPEDAAFRSVLPMLSRQFRLLWQARMCLDSRVDPMNAPDELLALFPAKPRLSSEGDYVQRKTMNAARQVDYARLQACMAELSDCDARLKGLLPSFSASEALEQMVLRMVQVMSKVPA
ncbi:MAG TPA: DNA polymerase III subunit delta [Fimbriimonadaceae bacterium]|nr:DNA polymerase III subunit delta [Fimbriimonadaceae bacterium]